MIPRWLALAGLCSVGVLSACGGDGGPGPIEQTGGPGTLTATLVSPNGAEGAALIHMIGNGATGLEAAEGELFTEVSGDTVKVLLLRGAPGALSFRFSLPDTLQKPAIQIIEVADGGNDLRTGLAGYSLRLAQ